MSARLAVADLAFGHAGRVVGAAVSFEIEAGEIVCLLGPNGGGKTTLLKTILGLIPPIAGSISIDGEDVAPWSARRRALALGYVPQAGAGQFPFTVREIVLMGRSAHHGLFAAPGRHDYEEAEAALDRLGILDLAQRDWTRLSGGERQLALIARALAQAPLLLLLDEPTANLDFGNQVRVMDEVRRLGASGLGILFSTHHPEQAFACARRVAMLHDGRLARLGAPAEVITPELMRLAYDVEVDVVALDGGMRMCVPRSWR